MSLYKPSSNFKFLSQGVAAAIQKRHLSAEGGGATAGQDAAPAGNPTTPRAATAPKPSKNVLRVVSISTPRDLRSCQPAEVYGKGFGKCKRTAINCKAWILSFRMQRRSLAGDLLHYVFYRHQSALLPRCKWRYLVSDYKEAAIGLQESQVGFPGFC